MTKTPSSEVSRPRDDRRWDDFQVIMWGSTPVPSMAEPDRQVSAEEARRYTQALRNNGCTAVLAYRQVPNCSWWKPHRWKLYAENINHAKAYPIGWHTNWEGFVPYVDLAARGDERCYWRKPCLNDPAYWEESRRRLQPLVQRRLQDAQPLCYSLGDEVSITLLTTPWDFCFCPHCMTAMRAWLKESYESLGALNEEWGTSFASWDEVKPDTTAQARKRKDRNYSSWNDHRAFMDLSFANFLARNQEYIRELDPGALVGIGGTQHPSALGGYDLWLLSTRLSYLDVYDGGGAVEAYRSFRTPEMRFARTFANAARDSLAEIWRLLLHGLDGAVKFLGAGFEDADRPAETAADLREMQSGLYKLLKSCVRDDDPIAIHFSQASIRAGYIMQQRLPTEVDNEVATEADHEREATFKIVEDLGFQWKFISSEQLERGDLSRFKVLIMPGSWAVSDRELREIARFVENGGTVIANGFPAWMDGHCKLRKQAGLDEVFGVRRESFQPAPWTVGVQARPVYGRWNAFYSYYWWTCYPKTDERLAIALPDGPLSVPAMELDVKPTTAKPEAEIVVPAGRGETAKVGMVFRNRYGKGQGILLNFRLLDYLDWRKAQGKPGDSVARDPAMVRSCLGLFQRLLKSAGLEPRTRVAAGGESLAPGYERVYFKGEGNEYVALLRDSKAATELALDLEAFEANRAAQAQGRSPGRITLSLATGGGHVYDVRQHRYLGRMGELSLEPHKYQPAVFQVSPYKLESISVSAPASAERDRPVRLEVTVAADRGEPGTHVVNVALLDPQGRALPAFRGVNIVTAHGKGSGEITFWDIDAAGAYNLVATELASGLQDRRQVTLSP